MPDELISMVLPKCLDSAILFDLKSELRQGGNSYNDQI